MKSLNGLWKIKDGKVLVQLHGAEMRDYHATRNIRSMKGVLRVIRGNWRARDAVTNLVLISILPKRDVTITIIEVSFHHTHYDDYYSIEGVVVCKDQNEYGPGPVSSLLAQAKKSLAFYTEETVTDLKLGTSKSLQALLGIVKLIDYKG